MCLGIFKYISEHLRHYDSFSQPIVVETNYEDTFEVYIKSLYIWFTD